MSDSDPAAEILERARDHVQGALDELRPLLLGDAGQVSMHDKDDGTPVSSADLAADRRLRGGIHAAFPDHGILSEEERTSVPDDEWVWIIDPIDGTSNFISGLPWWCVSVALAHRGEIVLAAVDAPALGHRYLALRGRGATRDGEPIAVRSELDPHDPANRHVPLLLTLGTAQRAREQRLRLNPRVLGAAALDLCTVAEGTAAGSVAMVPHVWDVAAGSLLVAEAGGQVRTLAREPLLPLKVGDEHADRSAVVAAGPSERWIDEVLAPLPPPWAVKAVR